MDKKAAVFEFTGYDFQPAKKRAVFYYATRFADRSSLEFSETLLLPKKLEMNGIPAGLTKKLLESLHIMLGISYHKFYFAPKIELPYALAEGEAHFWNEVYKKGLGEFMYRNKLDPGQLAKFEARSTKSETNPKVSNFDIRISDFPSRSLVGIGGGKDSIVAAELLKIHGEKITAFVVENKPSELINSIIETIGIGSLKIQRQLDQKVHEKHEYNGHIPISAVYAFLGVFACVLYRYNAFIVANEYSSNFGNLTYRGMEINHQWSKSFEFEQLFSEYLKNFVTDDVTYFSLLRPLYEIRIVKLFSRYPKYFKLFSSCNRNFVVKGKTHGGLWCLECPKCVFAFTLLSAFLDGKQLLKIFGRNLYEDEKLLPTFKDILSLGAMKPFDCVGTFEEAQVAFEMARRKHENTFIMKKFGSHKPHQSVFKTQKESCVPDHLKFLGMDSALIFGYGKEGKATEQYLQKYYADIKIGIAEIHDGKETFRVVPRKFPRKSAAFDIAVKTPGIKKELVKIPYTTATNIFFSKVKGRHSIIGVTGSKGKSTTASLIFHILKVAGKKVELLGNIGKPMLEYLLHPVQKDTIFVLELSSYQLDDIKYSPDIAVITNLFPEHMDYHGSLEKYYAAKENIFKFQRAGEHLICNQKLGKKYQSSLLGTHNQQNITSAVAAVKLLGVKESTIKKAIKTFKPLPHRLEKVGEYRGIAFYDDAISTTPESTMMAIKAIPKISTIFLGGQDRGYDFIQLEKTLKKYNIKNIVLFPDSGSKMLKNAKGLNILATASMEEAVQFAYKNSPKGTVCLLSCASPSYSLWKNFEEKGREFKKAVITFSK